MSIEVMEQAADKLEIGLAYPGLRLYHDDIRAAITALRTAIAEAEKQEPVEQDAKQWGNRLNDASWAAAHAWNRYLIGPMSDAIFDNIKGVIRVAILKYLEGYATQPAAQRQWVGLTEEERNDCLVEADPCECLATPEAQELMRTVEAKLKEKNE